MRIFLILCLCLMACGVSAQQRDSYFSDYESYATFVDSHITARDFIELIQTLGGRDEYTPEQLAGLKQRFLTAYTANFTDRAVIREVDLGGGFRQEMRVYWGEASGYIYFYAMLHERKNDMVVINFTMNSDVNEVLDAY